MKKTLRKKRRHGCVKVLGITFCLFVVAMVVVSIVASHMMKNLKQGIEMPREILVYEQLHTMRTQAEDLDDDVPPVEAAPAVPDDLPEQNLVQEIWHADLPTLECRFTAFWELTQEMNAIEEADNEVFWDAFWENRKTTAEYTEEERAAFIAYFQGKREFLKKIQAFVAQGGPVYPLKIQDGAAMELPHLAKVRQMTRWLSFATVAEAYAGNTDQAFDYICSALQCGTLVKDEPLLISYLVKNACDGIALWNTFAAFPPGTLSPQQANTLIRIAREHNAQPRGIRALKYEAYHLLPFFENPGHVEQENVLGLFGFLAGNHPVQKAASSIYASPMSAPVRHMNYARIVEITEEIYALSQQPLYAVLEASEDLEFRIESMPITYQIAKEFTPALVRVQEAQARLEAQYDLLWMGLTLEQFYVENGVYPLFIENAIPQEPLDPFSGEPYRYESTGDSFLLYSVGHNLEDDGGRHHLKEFDIVWRDRNAPTTEEIKEERKKRRLKEFGFNRK